MTWLDTWIQDLRYGGRALKRNPVLTLVTVLTLALGLGVNAGVFTVLNGILFRAPVDSDPASFVHLSPQYSGGKEQPDAKPWAVSVQDYRTYEADSGSLGEMSAWDNVGVSIGQESGSPVFALLVTCSFFHVYGLERPKMGRLFLEDECSTPGSDRVVVLGEEIWKSRFDADTEIIGKPIQLNRDRFTVVGIAPAGFSGRLKGPGIWIPYTMQPEFHAGRDFFRESGVRWLTAEGRLKPGYTRPDARAELAVLAVQQDRLEPGRKTVMSVTNGSLADEPALRSQLVWISPLVMGALILLLAIATTNVTVLLLSRAVARQREMGIRLSLGAGRARLIRMLLTESLLLAILAGIVSVYLTYQTPVLLAKILATGNSPATHSGINLTVFVYLALVTFAAACMAGLSPATEALRLDLATSMKGGQAPGSQKVRSRNLLIAIQVAMSLALLAGAGLFLRAQYGLYRANPGFEVEGVLLVPLRVDIPPYTEETADAFVRNLMRRVESIPGVQSVAFGSLPLAGSDEKGPEEVRLPGREKGSGRPAEVSTVSAGFFDTLRIPVLRGRAFAETEGERAAPVAIVSAALAEAWWPGADPVGRTIVMANGDALEIVGIARDLNPAASGVSGEPRVYRLRDPHSMGDPMLVRVAADPNQVALAIRGVVQTMDREMLVTPKTVRSLMDTIADRFSVLVQLLSVLALVALSLAVIGIFGVVAFVVRQRTKEFGIRAALGATRVDIVRTVLASGIRPVLAGLTAGSLLAFGGAMALRRVLQQSPVPVDPADPMLYGVVVPLLALVAAAAMFGPALRAAKANPIQTLRED
jgi:putative ABC transport system permease protein